MTVEASDGDAEGERFSRSFVYLMTFGVTLGALCFGYNLAIISPVLLYVQPEFHLDTTWQSVMAGAAVFAATVSSAGAGMMADRLGRRRTLLLTAALSVAGPVMAAAAPGTALLLAGRMITGLTFPFQAAFGIVYMAEMAPTSVRGRLLAFNQFQVNMGVLLSAVLSGAFSYLPDHQWRYMMGLAAVPALLFGVALFVLPESPRWLMARGRRDQATEVLQRIYGYQDVSSHVLCIQETLTSDPDQPSRACSTLSRIVRTPHVLRALAMGSCLSFFFAWSGINSVLVFSGVIIKSVGFPVEHAVWIQGLAGLAMFISIIPVICAVERFGRRPILLISLGGCALSLLLVSVGFHLTTANHPPVHPHNVTGGSLSGHLIRCQSYRLCGQCVQDADCGLCHDDQSGWCLPALNEHYSSLGPCAMDAQSSHDFSFALDYCPSVYTWIVVAGICLYCVLSQGLTALTFTINAEIYPQWARGTCMTLVMILFWSFNVVINFSFLRMVDAFNTYGTFWFFTAMCTLGFLLLALYLPETKNLKLEEVEQLFMTSQELQRRRQRRERSPAEKDEQELEMTRL